MSDPIDWQALLLNRPTPPPTWWVGEAISRKTSHTELRASAVMALICPPLMLDPGRPPFLPRIPAAVQEWIAMLRNQDQFLCLGDKGMKPAVVALVVLSAARDAMHDQSLVPELQEACKAAADVVHALEASGVPLSARNIKLDPEEKAELELQAAALLARRGGGIATPTVATAPEPPQPGGQAKRPRSAAKRKGDGSGSSIAAGQLDIARRSGLI